jgi:hypothetical protein
MKSILSSRLTGAVWGVTLGAVWSAALCASVAVRAAPAKSQAAAPPAATATVAAADAQRAEIDFWLTKYDAAELRAGPHRCPAPRFPSVSKQNDEIEAVNARMIEWRDCYNAFANYVNALPLPEERIPAAVRARMSKEELAQAKAHILEAQAFVVDSAGVNAKVVLADFDAWRNATEAYVKEHNIIVKASQANDHGGDGAPRRND